MFLKVIEWAESAPDVIVWKFPVGKNTIERGSSLTVREGQAVVFCDKGRMADVFGPGMYKLDTDTIPILTRPRRDACVQYITPEKRCQD